MAAQLSIILWLIFSLVGLGQVGPLVRIDCIDGFGAGRGAGVVVSLGRPERDGFIGRIMTAHHMVAGSQSLIVTYEGGKTTEQFQVVESNAAADTATIECWIPDGIHPVEMADSINEGDEIFSTGLTSGTLTGRVTLIEEGRLFWDGRLRPGDSGSPVFNRDGKLVAIVSGGWFWIRREVDGKEIPFTWPARAGLVGGR